VGGLISNDFGSMPYRVGAAGREAAGAPAPLGRIALLMKQWFTHPTAVRHCGIALQPGINLSHGQCEGLLALISAVIMHGFAIAMLANGAKAVINDSNRASVVRCKVIGPT